MLKKTLDFFNVKQEELPVVSRLLLLQFFTGAGIALFFTGAFTLFLEHYEASSMAYVYTGAGVLLLVGGFIFQKLEHKLKPSGLALTIILFLLFSTLAFRLGIELNKLKWLAFFNFTHYYLLYLLSTLMFWGLAALLFDVRQSRRLFGVISAGDIPAKLIGYLSASLIAPYTGSANLLYFAAACFGIALICWRSVFNHPTIIKALDDAHYKERPSHTPQRILFSVFGNKLILILSLLSFLVMATTSIINFVFYAEVKHEMHQDASLAAFIGIFLAAGRLIALLFKLIFTERIARRFGITGGLLTLPMVILFFSASILLLRLGGADSYWILYVFGAMGIFADVLKVSMQDPLFLSLMQPLSPSLRLKGHSIVKGVTDPFAMAFGGFIILTGFYIAHENLLPFLNYILFVFILLWLGMIVLLKRAYRDTLASGLTNRYLTPAEFSLMNSSAANLLSKRVAEADEKDALYALKLASNQADSQQAQILLEASYKSRFESVKIEAVNLCDSLYRDEMRRTLLDMMEASTERVKNQITGILSRNLRDALSLFPVLHPDTENNERKFHRLKGLIQNTHKACKEAATDQVIHLSHSADPKLRRLAADIIAESDGEGLNECLFTLLHDSHTEVRAATIRAVFMTGNVNGIRESLTFLEKPAMRKDVLRCLPHLRSEDAFLLLEEILRKKTSTQLNIKLIRLLPGMDKTMEDMVLDLLKNEASLKNNLLERLFVLNAKMSNTHLNDLHDLILKEVELARYLFNAQASFISESKFSQLAGAIQLEKDHCFQRILNLISLSYGTEYIKKVRFGWERNRKEAKANAEELLQVILPISLYKDILPILHIMNGEHSHKDLHIQSRIAQDVCEEILQGHPFKLQDWTIACALYACDNSLLNKNSTLVRMMESNPSRVISETAIYRYKNLI